MFVVPHQWAACCCRKRLERLAISLICVALPQQGIALANENQQSDAGGKPLTRADPPQAAKPVRFKPPNLNPTQIPTAYVAEWGNYFVSSSAYTYSQSDRSSVLTTDGSLNLGLGLGHSRRSLAVEIDFNQESLANRNNGGSLDVRLGRELISTNNFALQLGAGWLGVASYGLWPKPGGSPYGVITAAWPLRPKNGDFRQTMQVNLGGGGGRFQRIDAVNLISNGAIASIGVELTPSLGISTGWAGKGLNASVSYVPLRSIPLYLTLSAANISAVSGSGRAVAFGFSWGGSFRTASFP
jgi:hypothetical protein